MLWHPSNLYLVASKEHLQACKSDAAMTHVQRSLAVGVAAPRAGLPADGQQSASASLPEGRESKADTSKTNTLLLSIS